MTDGAIVQVASDRIVYRASALGSCSKALAAARLEYEPLRLPEDVAARYAAGHKYEDIAVAKMEADGWEVWGRQQEVVLQLTGKLYVVGHVDGYTRFADEVVTFDVKSQSDNEWRAFERDGWESGFFPKYRWQFSAYDHATQLLCLLVRINRDTDEVKIEWPTEPYYTVADIRAKVLAAEAIATTGILPGQCDSRMYPCPFFYLHENDTTMLTDPEIDVLAREHERAKTAEKTEKEKKEAARKKLREAVGEDRRATTISGVKVTFYDQNNPPSLNRERLQATARFATGMELNLDAYMDRSTSERLRVTLPKEKKEDEKKEEGDGDG